METTITTQNQEKILYSLHTMNVAAELLKVKNSSFFKRVISRLIIIRMDDFINFARRYNNNLKGTISSTEYKNIKNELNTLDSLYNDYISELRNNFAGHFKDGDFFTRIELWGNIEEDIILYFYELAQEITTKLHLDLDTEFTLTSQDHEAFRIISDKYNTEGQATFSVDILALTRPNTGSILVSSDLQEKAAMLNTISIMLSYEFELINGIKQKEVVDVIQMLILVDIINFADNLFTRNLDENAKQKMDGFDTLVNRHRLKDVKELFEAAKQNTTIPLQVDRIRQIRNIIGGHIDDSQDIRELLEALASVESKKVFSLYQRMRNLLHSVFKSNIIFRPYLIVNEPLKGVVAVQQGEELKGFNGQPYEAISVESPVAYDDNTMNSMWCILESDINNTESLSYFSTALMFRNEEGDKRIERYISLGQFAQRTQIYVYSKVELFIEEIIKTRRNDLEFFTILHKIMNYKNVGENHILSQIFLRELQYTQNLECILILLELLGKVSDNEEKEVINCLQNEASKPEPIIRWQAILALLEIDTRCNGVATFNKSQLGSINIVNLIFEIVEDTQYMERLQLVLILMCHLHFDSRYIINIDYNKEKYYEKLKIYFLGEMYHVYKKLPIKTRRNLNDGKTILHEINLIIDRALTRNNFPLATIKIGDLLFLDYPTIADKFYALAASQWINIDWSQTVLIETKMIAFIKINELHMAYEMAQKLCAMEPSNKYNYFNALYIAIRAGLNEESNNIKEELTNSFSLSLCEKIWLSKC
ncbi:hypothetical protein [Bacillus wiedmannii]|uniref:Uncharacterized protein n=1 Tax=Bacillus wiedmannii TaxID=1890302 RepID=A0A2C5PIT3_9BACI|nr:hypothetical protein [Bacillus wiedmannii]PGD64131.1 hypothetical protein COM41_12035 [Bacillus wiedmannii]PHG58656.1 hypothetical protein COI65_20085 [Bacillus wiedmannii]